MAKYRKTPWPGVSPIPVLGFLALVVSLLIAWPGMVRSQSPSETPSVIDSVEYRLEIERHRKFMAARGRKGAKLTPFVSDGCSGGLSAGWALISNTMPAVAARHGAHPPWEQCCVEHDRLYHTGGPADGDAEASFSARRLADKALRACVIATGTDRAAPLAEEYGLTREDISALYRVIADVMYRAVRLGGVPCSGLDWRWGFGWPQCD